MSGDIATATAGIAAAPLQLLQSETKISDPCSMRGGFREFDTSCCGLTRACAAHSCASPSRARALCTARSLESTSAHEIRITCTTETLSARHVDIAPMIDSQCGKMATMHSSTIDSPCQNFFSDSAPRRHFQLSTRIGIARIAHRVIRWQDPEARFFCPQRAHDASTLTTCTGHQRAQGAVPDAPRR